MSAPQLIAHAGVTLFDIEPTLSAIGIRAHEGGHSSAIMCLLATLRDLVAHMSEFRQELSWRAGSAGASARLGRPTFCMRACE